MHDVTHGSLIQVVLFPAHFEVCAWWENLAHTHSFYLARRIVFQPIMASMRPMSHLVELRVRSLGWLLMGFMERRFKGNQVRRDEF